jgi:beta-1,4-mannosyl-glycoprotein beta-1,4-N-acetylglucosaminyltransferase
MIYDTFSFYNEFDVLRKRLKYLYNHVDKFVLAESTVTHSGQPKELLFEKRKSEFAEYLDKIIHVIVDDNPTDENPWARENHQRNCTARGLIDAKPDDIVMISDVDEIPTIDSIKHFANADVMVASVHMVAFQYSFKYIQVHEPWFGTVMTRKRNVDENSPQYFRDKRWSFPHYENSGWHLSSFGGGSHVYNKLKTYAHCNDEKHQNGLIEEDFDKIVESGKWTDGKTQLPQTPYEILRAVPDAVLHG